jgi:hypothetical protein
LHRLFCTSEPIIGAHLVDAQLSEDWWRRLEGRPTPEDADHWLDVYDQLLRHFRPLVHGDGDEQLRGRMLDIEKRRQYWALVKAVRAERPTDEGAAQSNTSR